MRVTNFACAGKCEKIRERNRDIADFDFSLPDFLMRQLQEIFQKPQVVHRFERRGMDCVAAKNPMFFDTDASRLPPVHVHKHGITETLSNAPSTASR
jgi:hypothetical protein